MSSHTSLLLLLLAYAPFSVLSGDADKLGDWNVDKDRITVSGLSAGGAFAVQFHVGYSSAVSGAGSWAGLAELCFSAYSFNCMYAPGLNNAGHLADKTRDIANDGRIDPVVNMEKDKVYIFQGTRDSIVDPKAANVIYDFYSEFLTDPGSQMLLKDDIACTHAVVSDHTGTECGETNEDIYIENCDFDSPYAMLDHVLGGDVNPGVPPGTYQGIFTTFDQDEFFGGNAKSASMDDTGYVYVPPKCTDDGNECLLHFHFHGCQMYAGKIGTDFIVDSGFLELADANNMVVIFPQTVPDVLKGNPNGCFDWFEYTNPSLLTDKEFYATHDAPQMDAVYQMLKRAARMD